MKNKKVPKCFKCKKKPKMSATVAYCKSCMAEYMRDRYHNDPEAREYSLGLAKKHYWANKDEINKKTVKRRQEKHNA